MITIVPADEAARKKLGLTDPDLRAMIIDDNGEIGGHVLFTIRETEMELLSTDVTDALLQEGLIRAALNYGYRRAVEVAFGSAPEMRQVFITLRFCEEVGRFVVSVPEFFQRGCRCAGKN